MKGADRRDDPLPDEIVEGLFDDWQARFGRPPTPQEHAAQQQAFRRGWDCCLETQGICAACDGAGAVFGDEGLTDCPECDGTGEPKHG